MSLSSQIDKFKLDGKDLRLTVILESYNKKATKKNIDALKMLIEDNDLDSISMFLGDEEAVKKAVKKSNKEIDDAEILAAIAEEAKRKPNEDDFEIFVKKQLGDPKDPNSLGNRILSGQTFHWYMKTNIYPNVLLNKFATLAGRSSVEIDHFPNFKSSPPTYECCIAGTKQIKRVNETIVG